MMNIAPLLIAGLLVGGSPGPTPSASSQVRDTRPVLRVILADALESKPIGGARVFILSDDGKILVEGVSDANGQVDLLQPKDGAGAAFIFAEHPRFFIGGVRWKAGFTERFISLAWLGGL
jgi:hypothetical protein